MVELGAGVAGDGFWGAALFAGVGASDAGGCGVDEAAGGLSGVGLSGTGGGVGADRGSAGGR